jgi:hypothetical protein
MAIATTSAARFGRSANVLLVTVALFAWGLVVAAPTAATVAPRVTDLAVSQIVAIDGGFAVTVPEAAQNADLNGDGVRDDSVIFVVRPGADPVNTGLTSTTFGPIRTAGGFVVPEPEAALGTDETGDGDTADTVAVYWDDAHGVTILPYALGGGYFPPPPVLLADGSRAMYLSEAGEGTDLNDDGDLLDSVFHVLQPGGTLVDVGVAGAALNSIVPLPTGGAALTVGESQQAGVDLNGDGDAADAVVAVWTAGALTQTHLATEALFQDITVLPSGLLIAVPESQQHADLNGDGDQSDKVPVLWNPTSSVILPIAAAAPAVRLSTGTVVFLVAESSQGGLDRNGDGDASDRVVAVWDPAAPAVIVNVGVAADGVVVLPGGALAMYAFDGSLRVRTASGDIRSAPFTAGSMAPVVVDATHVAAVGQEGATDRNGDGDTLDFVAAVWNWDDGTVVYPPAALQSSTRVGVAPDGSLILGVNEAAQNTDLNDDGDLLDAVLRLWSPTSGFASFAVATSWVLPVGSGDWLAYTVNENADGGLDRNGDGDSADMVLGLYGDLPDGTPPVITGLTVTPAQVPPFGSVVVTAHVADASSTITRASLRYGVTKLTMTAVDGAYDETAGTCVPPSPRAGSSARTRSVSSPATLREWSRPWPARRRSWPCRPTPRRHR